MIRYMRGLADIQLDVRGGDIIVDLPGTSYTVTYHKPAVSPQLLAVAIYIWFVLLILFGICIPLF